MGDCQIIGIALIGMVQGTMTEFSGAVSPRSTSKGSGAGDGSPAWRTTCVPRLCVVHLCKLRKGIMARRS